MKKLLVLIIVVMSSISYAQQGASSPYSFYGIGSLKFKGTVENQSMGGISVVRRSGINLLRRVRIARDYKGLGVLIPVWNAL